MFLNPSSFGTGSSNFHPAIDRALRAPASQYFLPHYDIHTCTYYIYVLYIIFRVNVDIVLLSREKRFSRGKIRDKESGNVSWLHLHLISVAREYLVHTLKRVPVQHKVNTCVLEVKCSTIYRLLQCMEIYKRSCSFPCIE